MELFSYPINKDEQIKKIMEDTEEIISTFKQISSLIVTNIEDRENRMYHLGKKLINYKEEQANTEEPLGCAQINFI